MILREPIHGNLPGRGIENVNEIRLFFQQHSLDYDFNEQKLELLTPKQQIHTLMNTDIFIGILGSGFINVIFMIPGSVAISYSPPNVGGFFFNTVSEFAQVRYIGVYNSSVAFPPECKNCSCLTTPVLFFIPSYAGAARKKAARLRYGK